MRPTVKRAIMREKIASLLWDDFTDPRAAGAVNGTVAEPGPGTRTVNDTANGVTITGGNLSQTGFTALRDPGYWLNNAIIRIAGRLVTIQVNRSQLLRTRFGWDNAVGGFVRIHSLKFNLANVLQVYVDAVLITIGAWAAVTDYEATVVLRSTGVYYFIKGGAFTTWVLLWVADSSADSPLYVGIVVETGGGTLLSDYFRVPDILWLPAPIAYDTFTRANGALGNTEGEGPDGQKSGIRAWADSVGTWAIAGNTATCTVLAGGVGVATVDGSTLDVLHQANLTRAGGIVGGVVRYADANNYVYFGHDGVNALLTKRVGGVETPVISAVTAYAAGAPCVCVVEGTAFSLYYNNVRIGVTSVVADAGLQTGTQVGLYTTNVGNSMDVMQTFPRGTNGEYWSLEEFTADTGAP